MSPGKMTSNLNRYSTFNNKTGYLINTAFHLFQMDSYLKREKHHGK